MTDQQMTPAEKRKLRAMQDAALKGVCKLEAQYIRFVENSGDSTTDAARQLYNRLEKARSTYLRLCGRTK